MKKFQTILPKIAAVCIVVLLLILSVVLTVKENGCHWLIYDSVIDENPVTLQIEADTIDFLEIYTEAVEKKQVTGEDLFAKVIDTVNRSKILGKQIFSRDDVEGNYTCFFDFHLKDGRLIQVQAEGFRWSEEEPEKSIFFLLILEDGEQISKYSKEYFFEGPLENVFWDIYDKI